MAGCATPRSHGLLGINYSSQPPRVSMRWECNGEAFSTQGTGVCEQRAPSTAKVSVKIPPLEGRVIYSNGQLKATEDFNWYPAKGFWLWKKKPIKDTWAELSLGEIASTFGDWPVALDVAAMSGDAGLIVTRGILYHRVCNDQDIPCSKLEVAFQCAGHSKMTGPGHIEKCERMSGSTQALEVHLKGAVYEATPGAKVYLSVPRLGITGETFTLTKENFRDGVLKLELPELPVGPTLVGIRMSWVDDADKIQSAETRILMVGFSPEWTGLDSPHWFDRGDHIEFVRPVLSDLIEANVYEGRELMSKTWSTNKIVTIRKPGAGEMACAFAWQRDSSDQTSLCVNSKMEEGKIP